MKPFKYGANPHESASHDGLSEFVLYPGGELSFNAYLDIDVGFRLAGGRLNELVYVKHALPIFAVRIDKSRDWHERLRQCVNVNAGKDFGCFVYTGELTAEVVDAMSQMRHHTIAAYAVSESAQEQIASVEFQKTNRGVIVAIGDFSTSSSMTYRMQSGASTIETATELPVGVDDRSLAARTVKLGRTLTACVVVDGDVMATSAGHVDPLLMLRATLGQVRSLDLSGVLVATDACFSVKDPLPLLLAANVEQFHLFGEKSEYAELEGRLRGEGIKTEIYPRRAFSYFP